VACGDTLAAIGPAGEARPEFRNLLQKAVKSKDVRELQNLARVLGAYGHVAFDEPLSFLASGRRPPRSRPRPCTPSAGSPSRRPRPSRGACRPSATRSSTRRRPCSWPRARPPGA
jgi:hypothetical protein